MILVRLPLATPEFGPNMVKKLGQNSMGSLRHRVIAVSKQGNHWHSWITKRYDIELSSLNYVLSMAATRGAQ
jgi:hypothetical protein